MNNQIRIVKKIFSVLLVALSVFVLYACKKVDKITVIFINTDLEVKEINKGEKVERPNNPLKSGYTFENWYTDSDFKELFSFDTILEENVKIYALFYASIAQLKEEGSHLEHNTISTTNYYVKAKIKSITNLEWGNMTIEDETGSIGIYGLNREDGEKFIEIENKPIVGDTILLRGPLKKFGDTVELNTAFLLKILDSNSGSDIDIKDYEEVTVHDARGKNVGSKVLVTGVVSSITYADKMKPNGVYILDNTNSIYVYSNEVASSVEVGEKIKVAASRANFILDTELSLAQSHGYQGAIQLDSAHLIEKISKNNKIDTSWVTEKSIKSIMDTDVKNENITTTVFKVKAFINKVEGKGFTNYYFNDIDNSTGSYVYSNNNGSDFKWLDQYDGQLRTVYLSVINAKSTPGEVIYRFMPIEIGEVYTYDQKYNSEYAVKYHALKQFESVYSSGISPDTVLVTNISSEHLKIKDVKLTYTSSNLDVVYFEEVDGKLILKIKDAGESQLTISALDEFSSYSETIKITVESVTDYESITVEEAIKLNDNTEVVVKGIVAASLVNKTGFYLVDETGLIAVQITTEALKGLELGNEVVIKGNKVHIGVSETAVGQIAIDKAEVVLNLRGNHEYSTNSFKTGKTLGDFVGLDKLIDYSTEVYIFEAEIFYEETSFFTRYQLRDGEFQMNIYSSGAGQLKFLEQFQNKKVTVEFTVVNWNGKSYSGSIISVSDGVNKAYSDNNFR